MSKLALFLCLLLAARSAVAESLRPRDVLAWAVHGNEEYFCVAQITASAGPRTGEQTTIYLRGNGGGWAALLRQPIPTRAVSMTSRGNELALLLDSGQWMIVYSDGTAYSTAALPNGSAMIALAASPDAWWAVGLVAGGIAAVATQPATQPAATRPAAVPVVTTRLAERLVLFSLRGNDWTAVAELPPDLPEAGLSLGVFDDVPYVATVQSPRQVRLLHLRGSQWTDEPAVRTAADVVALGLIPIGGLPTLWVAPTSGPDLLFLRGSEGMQSVTLAPPAGSAPNARAVAEALGNIRQVALVDGKLIEQRYNPKTAAPDGKPTPLELPGTTVEFQYLQYLQYAIVMTALAFAIVASLRQRVMMRGVAIDPGVLALAPLGRRLAAGLIDALPIVLALLIAGYHAKGNTQAARDLLLLYVYIAACVFYVLYTALIETFTGRSIGKMLAGLRVVQLDGAPPRRGALVTRNVLRLIDAGLFFVPLVVILFSPLRQRAGDVAAGTLVVLASGRGQTEEAQPTEPAQQDQDAGAPG